MKKRVLILVAFVMAAMLLVSCSQSEHPTGDDNAGPVNLQITSIQEGGGWYVLGGIMSNTITPYLPAGSTLDVIPGPGAIGNIPLVDEGLADLGFTFHTNAVWAYEGKEGFESPCANVRALVSGLGDYKVVIFTDAKVPYDSLEEIIENKYPLKLAIYQQGSAAYIAAMQVLKALNVTEEDIKSWGGDVRYVNYDTLKEYMLNDTVEMWIGTSTPDHPTLSEVCFSKEMKFLSFSNEMSQTMVDQYGYSAEEMPPGWFPEQDYAVNTLGFRVVLICHKDLPDDIAYRIAKGSVETREQIIEAYSGASGLSGETAWKDTGVGLHPGAESYYLEAGFMK